MSLQEYVVPGFSIESIEQPVAHEWVQYIVVGFAFAAAAAWAYWCRRTGGSPVISAGWRGFTVACYR